MWHHSHWILHLSLNWSVGSRDSLQVKFEVTDMHNLALFLHSPYKGLRKLSTSDKTTVYALARSYVDRITILDTIAVSQSPSATSTLSSSAVGAGWVILSIEANHVI